MDCLTPRECLREQGIRMDGLREFLGDLKRRGLAQGNFVGLLNIVIGRRVEKKDGTLVSTGVTWRELAELFRKVRWNKEAVRELGIDPANLPPRDRYRYWYLAIAHAKVDSKQAVEAGDRLAQALRLTEYVVGAAPSPRTR